MHHAAKVMSGQDFFVISYEDGVSDLRFNSFKLQIYTRKFRLFSAVCEFQTANSGT